MTHLLIGFDFYTHCIKMPAGKYNHLQGSCLSPCKKDWILARSPIILAFWKTGPLLLEWSFSVEDWGSRQYVHSIGIKPFGWSSSLTPMSEQLHPKRKTKLKGIQIYKGQDSQIDGSLNDRRQCKVALLAPPAPKKPQPHNTDMHIDVWNAMILVPWLQCHKNKQESCDIKTISIQTYNTYSNSKCLLN